MQQGNTRATVDLDAVPPVALCAAVSLATLVRIHPLARLDRRDAGSALPDHADDGQGADSVPERQADRHRPGHALSLRPARRRAAGLGAGLGAHLRAGARLGTDRRGPAHDDLRAFDATFAGILRRQADRRPDVPHRIGNRPHQPVHFPALPRFRNRCADDPDDHSHPLLDQSTACHRHAIAAADHCLADPQRA